MKIYEQSHAREMGSNYRNFNYQGDVIEGIKLD